MSPAEDVLLTLSDDEMAWEAAFGAPALACAEASVLLVAFASLEAPRQVVAAAKANMMVGSAFIVRYVIACDNLRLTT